MKPSTQPLSAAALGKVAVLYGGNAAERAISIQSGEAALAALLRQGVNAVGIDTQQGAVEALQQLKPDRAFIALHGVGGEDGKIQAVLEYLGIPYTGSGVMASALCMDKLMTKRLWQAMGLPTPAYVSLSANQDWVKVLASLGGEAMVKPAHEGSSIGMSRVDQAAALESAYAVAAQFDTSVLAEQFIRGAEYTVDLLEGKALPPIRLIAKSAFYDFQAKYLAEDTEYLCPCGLDADQELALKRLAEAAFAAVGASGWGRVDVMADAQGQFYLLEVNTVPGLTSHSLVPMAAQAAGLGFDALILAIAAQTL